MGIVWYCMKCDVGALELCGLQGQSEQARAINANETFSLDKSTLECILSNKNMKCYTCTNEWKSEMSSEDHCIIYKFM